MPKHEERPCLQRSNRTSAFDIRRLRCVGDADGAVEKKKGTRRLDHDDSTMHRVRPYSGPLLVPLARINTTACTGNGTWRETWRGEEQFKMGDCQCSPTAISIAGHTNGRQM